jgi:hypothetical protein
MAEHGIVGAARWALVGAALVVSGCDRPSAGFAEPPPGDRQADDRSDARASTTGASPGAGCPPQPPSGACPEFGQRCDYGNTSCACSRPCMGAEPVTPPPDTWACQTRDPKCPDAVPEAGARCRPHGLRCGYGTCGGASASCEHGKWVVYEHGPPP